MTEFNYEAIYDFALEHMNTADDLAEKIFSLYFYDNFLTQKIDIQGHLRGDLDNRTLKEFKNGNLFSDFKDNYLRVIIRCLLVPIAKGSYSKEEIVANFSKHEATPNWVSDFYCVDCGCTAKVKKIGNLYTNNFKDTNEFFYYNEHSHTPCQFKDGIGHYSNIINVPSGKLVFSNHLFSLFDRDLLLESNNYINDKSGYSNDINSDYGVKLNTEFWNKHKLIYIQVGNTSPSIYQNKKTYEISCKFDKTTNPLTKRQINNFTKDENKKGEISTDIWAVFGMDYTALKYLCKRKKENFENFSDSGVLVEVPPGKYKVTSYNAAKYADQDTFFTVTKVED